MQDNLPFYRSTVELFLVHGKLVAQQQAFTLVNMKESYHEVKHYYCPSCGDVWGTRIEPDAISPRHHFYKSLCKSCGGDESMLCPWEEDHLEFLGPNVLAYLFLQASEDAQGERE